MIFRDNIQSMVRNKNVLILMASCTTGYTANKGIEAISYYGGEVVGVAALYSMVDEINGLPVRSVFNVKDIPDYESFDYKDCPYCKRGRKLDALVNSHGYSWL
jgi:orotate phosphoribosyltransferase